jgi:hypothetical protein
MAKTHKSTLNPILDFFAMGAAKRNDIDSAVRLFKKAMYEDLETALRVLFYIRDIRGGQGERDIFRACVQEVPEDTIKKNLHLFPEHGRWDDLFALPVEWVAPFIKEQLQKDLEAEKPSLCAKWMPSENTSSKETVKLARKLIRALDMTPREYRKMLSKLRKRIGILERKMSANRWDNINYSKLPSQALRKHIAAFQRHDEEGFNKYMDRVESGEEKINTSTIYTYEVFDMLRAGHEREANVVWDNLPDYTDGKKAIVVADVSGSMTGRPMDVSVSLALYFAERNEGAFKDHFITFSGSPDLVQVVGNSLSERLGMIEAADWGYNTNLEAVFNLLLETALDSNKEDMPEIIYIISDMEFDRCTNADETIFENAKNRFKAHDLELPHVVFWNVDSRQDNVPATIMDGNVTLISGMSASTFSVAVEGKAPLEVMADAIEKYDVKV